MCVCVCVWSILLLLKKIFQRFAGELIVPFFILFTVILTVFVGVCVCALKNVSISLITEGSCTAVISTI